MERLSKSEKIICCLICIYKLYLFPILFILGIDIKIAVTLTFIHYIAGVHHMMHEWEMENAYSKLETYVEDLHSVIDNFEEDYKELRKDAS